MLDCKFQPRLHRSASESAAKSVHGSSQSFGLAGASFFFPCRSWGFRYLRFLKISNFQEAWKKGPAFENGPLGCGSVRILIVMPSCHEGEGPLLRVPFHVVNPNRTALIWVSSRELL
jgi:hypothetical protein